MRREWGIATLILLLILHLCFFKAIWGNRTLLQSARSVPSITPLGAASGSPQTSKISQVLDAGSSAWQSEPWLKFIGEELKRRAFPLWNPYQGFGRPMAANMQSQPFYPLTALLSLHLTPRTFSWYLVLRLLVAGVCGYGFLRNLVGFYPALAGSVACMLAGYLLLFINQPHISVEVLFPAALWAGERLLQKPGYASMIWFAVIILLVLLGGMPESAFLLFAFVYAYLLVRMLSQQWRKRHRSRQITYLLAATVAGLLLSAFFVLPFLEFAQSSFNVHMSSMVRGLDHDRFDSSVLGALLPLAFAPPTTLGGLRNYFGVVAFFLMFVAAASSCKRAEDPDPLKAVTWLTVAATVFVWLKRYGVPVINNLGSLPLLNQIDFAKYQEPIQSFSVAILVAVGLERLIRGFVSVRLQWIGWLLTVALIVLTWFASPRVSDAIFKSAPQSKPYAFLFAGALMILLAAVIRTRRHAYTTVLVAAELMGCFVLPAYLFFGNLPRRNANPYQGAPFVEYLRQHSGGDRIVAGNELLTPNWATAFGLYDIRDLDALYVDRYFPFLDAFFPHAESMAPDFKTCFRGWETLPFNDPLQKRLLQLSSIRYVASSALLVNANETVEEFIRQNPSARLMPNTRVDDDYSEVLMQHPPSKRLPLSVQVPNGDAIFHYAYGVSDAVWNKEGDGVGFTLEVKPPSGPIRKEFSAYLDPKHKLADRGWVHGALDLSEFRGRAVTLLFSTDPGPAGNTAFDWAGWANLGFAETDPAKQFHLVYNSDALIFKYDDILPRASIFYHAAVEKDNDGVLKRLASADWDPLQSVIVNSAELDAETQRQISDFNGIPAGGVEAAKGIRFAPREVRIETTLNKPGILMLNDSGFPGWEVTVDGIAANWFPADYLFRGVFLSAGEHRVIYSYKPKGFLFGSLISTFAAAVLVIIGFASRLAERI